MRKAPAFTLAELLIALAILGVIATFTIPKVLQSQQDQRFKAVGKEAVATIVGAYQAYQQANGPAPTDMVTWDLTPYMNYIKFETANEKIDETWPYNATRNCAGGAPCAILPSGAAIQFQWQEFNNTASTNAITFLIDPDGKVTTNGAANTPGKSVQMILYYNGRITTVGEAIPYYSSSGGPFGATAGRTPDWFSWD
jgi:prepilin-type N-terminal cleavage/methylation domain-containing protein